jgi:tRNA A58 N-methylase Trm61
MQLFNFLKSRRSIDWFANDKDFDGLYPQHVAKLSRPHWTPIAVAKEVSHFLAEPGKKILDIGSGAGKFCLIAAASHKDASFYGIEQRLNLVHIAEEMQQKLQLPNAHFIHGNITDVNFSDFDHFYFYNSFYEQLPYVDKIDLDISFSKKHFDYYTSYLFTQLDKLPAGTRLATYHAQPDQVPNTYQLIRQAFTNRLEFWIKS